MVRNSKNHLDEVNETYLNHMVVNFKIDLSTLVIGFKFMYTALSHLFLKKVGKKIVKTYKII